jgi:peptidoglycan hydrolase-like protein with peptidoglycan-binding domain
MRRRTLAFVVLGAVVLSSLVTWFASSTIRSPSEIAAQAAPPVPAPILAPVEQRVLATKIVSRGTGHYGSTRTISLTASALKNGASVVTTLPQPGARLAEGDVLLTVSGRPTFLLDGAQPTYRDLGPGMSGKDVRQLENALRRLGLRPGSVDGYYDYATARAVTALYRKHGFDPVVATTEQLAAVQPRESTLVRGARAVGGTQFPSDELVFMSSTPLRTVKVTAKPGSGPKGPLLTVSNSTVSVEGALPVEQAGLIKTGGDVLIDEPALAIKAKGTISRIAEQPGTDGADGFHVAFSVSVPKPPRALVGASVRLTVPIKSTEQSTLAVPVGALSLGADGASRVQRSVGGVISPVRVEPGLSAEGYVAVTALGGELAAGDLVVVGFNQ